MQRLCLALGTALLSVSCLSATLAHADITKCVDQSGRISYSDGSCGEATLIGYLDIQVSDSLSHPSASASARLVPRLALDPTPARESRWALLPSSPRHVSIDSVTIRTARDALAASDRGLAAIRTQKIASSR